MSHPIPGHDYGEPTHGEPYSRKDVASYNKSKSGPRNTAYDKKKKIAKKMPSVGKYLSASPKHLIDQINKRPGESAYSHLKRLLD